MTVTELLDRIVAVYPGATPEALKGVKSSYYAMLRKREGEALAQAADAVIGTFSATTRKPFPIAADFLAAMPVDDQHSTPQLDFAGRRERTARLTADWLRRQGEPEARGIPELRAALLFVATPIIELRCWSEDPAPLKLTSDQIRLAVHRAVSQERRRLHGVHGTWEQTREICERWGIEARWDDWASKEPPRGQLDTPTERQPFSPTSDQHRVAGWKRAQTATAAEPPPFDEIPEYA